MKKDATMNEFKGFSLFQDVEDFDLRIYNNARILTNISVDHSKGEKITPQGVSLVAGYFLALPVEERKPVVTKYLELMKKEGFNID